MIFLLLATIASAGNALTMKFAGSKSDNAWALLLFNAEGRPADIDWAAELGDFA
ncbi:MAG: hypothetical protein Q4G41_04420 [Coriobacteriales bacterium]|nr:hypothetical protein [Coriobacteriales bacterium]MDO5709341.1 hypothetical protein [Coriobacteriales bacterium]